MTVQEMTSVDLAALGMTPGAYTPPDPFSLSEQPTGAIAFVPVVDAGARLPIDEPSSMTLALVGIVTLAAYRGIQKRLTGDSAAKSATPKLIKPRSIKPGRAA